MSAKIMVTVIKQTLVLERSVILVDSKEDVQDRSCVMPGNGCSSGRREGGEG